MHTQTQRKYIQTHRTLEMLLIISYSIWFLKRLVRAQCRNWPSAAPAMPGAQGPKTVKGARSDPNYVSRLLLDCVANVCRGGGQKLELRRCPSAYCFLIAIGQSTHHRATQVTNSGEWETNCVRIAHGRANERIV